MASGEWRVKLAVFSRHSPLATLWWSGVGPATLPAPVIGLSKLKQTRHQRLIETRRRHIRQCLPRIAAIEVEIAVQIRPVILELLQNELFQWRGIGQTCWPGPLNACQRQQILEDALDRIETDGLPGGQMIRASVPARPIHQRQKRPPHPVHRHDILRFCAVNGNRNDTR